MAERTYLTLPTFKKDNNAKYSNPKNVQQTVELNVIWWPEKKTECSKNSEILNRHGMKKVWTQQVPLNTRSFIKKSQVKNVT